MGTKYSSFPRVQNPNFESCLKTPPLEIADFVCYSVHKKLNKNDEEFFNIIKSKFRNYKGNHEGYGLVIFPK